jgi:hypothetical protein
MLTAGRLFIVTCPVVLVQPVAVRVKVKVAIPGATPVTIPLFVTDATDGLLQTQVPPEDGDKVTTPFPHIAFVPTIVATGVSIIVKGSVVLLQTPAAVKVKVTRPAETLVTIPPLVTVATDGLLLIHVPPVAGDTAAVLPTQIEVLPIIATTGNAVTLREGLVWLHPVAVCVNVNETVPAESPVTVPELVTDATSELLLTQVPPVEGDRVVVPFTHIFAPPLTTGNG